MYPEAQWLVEMLAAAEYVVIITSASFGGRGEMRSYAFACPPKLRGQNILSFAEAYYVGGDALYR